MWIIMPQHMNGRKHAAKATPNNGNSF